MKKYIFIHPDPKVLHALTEATGYHLAELRKRHSRVTAVVGGYEGTLQSFMGRTDLCAEVDVLVTPGNSYGIMSGGYDLAVAECFPGVEAMVSEEIIFTHNGELNVGNAIVVENYAPQGPQGPVPFTCYAPTMRVPRRLEKGTDVPYVATLAALHAIDDCELVDSEERPINIERMETVLLPAMGHLTGGVPTRDVAHQMAMAIVTFEQCNPPETLLEGEARDRMIRYPGEYGFPYYKTPLL